MTFFLLDYWHALLSALLVQGKKPTGFINHGLADVEWRNELEYEILQTAILSRHFPKALAALSFAHA
ncbi:MAG: hypothetical protein INF79_00880 [Roseomonas sp.]|nr:hypothetical protein [Roseomonas sp.]